jgi:hypothetical protein
MGNQIRPLARLFRGMADLIDRDHTSPTRYAAIAKAASVVAARATAQELVAGRLWQVDGADLLAAAYAFHAGLARQQPPRPTSKPCSSRGRRRLASSASRPRSRPVGLGWTTLKLERRHRVRQPARSLRPWTRVGCPVLALVSWTRPMRPSCGRSFLTYPAASSSHEASSSD